MSVAQELAAKIPPIVSSLNSAVARAAARGAVVTYTVTPGTPDPAHPEVVVPPVISATITGPGI